MEILLCLKTSVQIYITDVTRHQFTYIYHELKILQFKGTSTVLNRIIETPGPFVNKVYSF